MNGGRLPGTPQIPDKLYFKIGEVAKIVGVEPYVLRYWETEFSEIAPVKSQSKQRLYRREDVELILAIRELLHTQKFTIKGAKQRITETRHGRQGKIQNGQISLNLNDPSLAKNTGAHRQIIQGIVQEMDDFLK